MWGVIFMLIVGLIAGAVARLVVPGEQDLGWLGTMALGVAGGYVGGIVGSLVFSPHKISLHPPLSHSFFGAVIGAVLLLLLYRALTPESKKPSAE